MSDVSIAVLAGGKSRRMGQNKSFVPLNGRPMIEHILDQLAALELPIFIVTNEPDSYVRYGLPLVPDLVPDRGALGGLYTALQWSSTPWVLCAACDMPFLRPTLLRLLLQRCTDVEAVAARLDGVWHAFPGVYSRACLTAFQASLRAGQYRLQTILGALHICPLDISEICIHDPHLRSFVNLNTPGELARYGEKGIATG
jgi:molybdopterin-guanine dinucleotide biosynthesis protein A